MDEQSTNDLDINGPNFNSAKYLEKIFKECSLREIMDKESEIARDTQTLHSDMQTLVYENYNKFISATETIRKMKNDFKQMENEMDLLASNMEKITTFSEKVNSNLQETRDKISHLSSVHSLLQRLQFIFKLPATLKARMDEKNYIQATQDYLHAQRVLQQYGKMPALQGIKKDCESLLHQLKQNLRKHFADSKATTKELMQSVDLLLQLDEPAKELCNDFLNCAENRLAEQLVLLKDQSEQRDIAEWIDLGCNGFLNDLCLIVGSFNNMFISSRINNIENTEIFESFASNELETFIVTNMKNYFDLVQSKIDSKQDIADTSTLAAALNRFYTKIESNQFSKEVNFNTKAIDIINHAGKKQCKAHLQVLKLYFIDTLTKVQQALTTPPMLIGQENTTKNLNEHLNSMIFTVVEKTKGVLQDLLAFINAENKFAKKVQFRESFCIDNVREGLVVCFLHHISASVRNCCVEENEDENIPSITGSDTVESGANIAGCDVDQDSEIEPRLPPPALFLLLSKFCLDFRNRSIHFLLAETDDVFHINHKRNSNALTNEMEISNSMHETAQYLLNYYVNIQGNNCSEMLIKSIETRDWLHTIEPRTVRAVMKRVIEDISAIDATVALLYEDLTTGGGVGAGGNNSSDSSKRTTATQHNLILKHQFKSNWSSYTSQTNQLDSSLVSNMHKLFSERIDIFSPVGFSRISILTGIIKISLKSFMECVRLQTFSKYGLQQIQVDTHYLQLYLWRFVADENLVHFLLDEILGSAVHRCLEPVLMEPSVVDIICERG